MSIDQPIKQIIVNAINQDLSFRVDNGKLLVIGDWGKVDEDLKCSIKKNKVEIIRQISRATKKRKLGGNKTITKRISNSSVPGSFAQQRLWLLGQMEEGGAHYNMSGGVRFSGVINRTALNKAFNSIVERHESLRTSFVEGDDGQLLQIIQPFRQFSVVETNVVGLSEEASQLHLVKLVDAEVSYAFDLSCDEMLRVHLVSVAENEHVLLLTMHHIASDGWSMSILIDEFSVLYRAYTEGQENPLSPLAIQYADYAYWQRHWFQGEVLDEQLAYWTDQLASLPVVHSLPLDHPRPQVQSFAGATYKTQIGVETYQALNALCLTAGSTLFMGLHAAFSVLLSRYSNETDIVMGSPIANREQEEVAPLIGFFMNNLVLRSDLSKDPTFTELLNQSKRMLLDAYAHQQTPFEKIVEYLQPERNLSHSPLFQVMLVLHNNEAVTLNLPGLTFSPVELGEGVAKYDLTLNLIERDERLYLSWEYCTDLFELATIKRMAAHFENLLKGLVDTPEESVFKKDMLSDAERHQQLIEWNDTAADYRVSKCIHELFEAQVVESSYRTAVFFEDKHLTYGELNTQANQLAHYLADERGVKPGSLVGICVERSLEMVVAILGTLKAGGAYVPLDPDYPEERLAFMLTDASLTTVITQRPILKRTPISEEQALCLDDIAVQQRLAKQLSFNLNSQQIGLKVNHLAYVIYTSGSTGNPKGVMIEHRSLVLSTLARSEYYEKALQSFLLLSSFSFDSSIAGLFWSLSCGAKLVIASKETIQEVPSILTLIGKHKVNYLLAIPSFYTEILRCIEFECCQGLALDGVILAGEQLLASVVHQHRMVFGQDCQLFNEYGPTEATVWSTVYCLKDLNYSTVPIGRSPNIGQIYVSNHEALVPTGSVGELHIGGPTLARGYLNRPDLSTSKFILSPFHDKANPTSRERLYKTGDLVRWLPDGNLEFLGRIDHQVKIRGFRIELGEIENVLTQHKQVRDAVVLAKESDEGNQRLVAYVVTDVAFLQNDLDDEQCINVRGVFVENLRQYLSQDLPDYMVPTAFVFLKKLPLTPNGKVDGKALPAPDYTSQKKAYVAPHSEMEKILCGLWQDVLGVERIGINDNFFLAGGHSLLATRLVAKINKTLKVKLSIKEFFSSQTPSLLALTIFKLGTGQICPDIVAVGRDINLLSSYAQQRLWVLGQIEGGGAHYNMLDALKISGVINYAAVNKAFNSIVERHESLRTSFVEGDDGQLLQIIQPFRQFSVVETNVVGLSEEASQLHLVKLVDAEVSYAFDLSCDEMLRVHLVSVAENEHVLLLTMHHIASDGWSMSILIDEFSVLYRAYTEGQENPLSPLAIQYADYAYWQRHWFQGEVLDEQLAYWTDQLASLPVVHSLPLDHPRPQVQSFAGATYKTQIGVETYQALNALCLTAGSTLFMGLHAAFSVLLSRYSNETDIVMGSPIANREQEEVAPLIGFFMNNLVLRSDLSKDPTFTELLNQSKRMLLDAYAHQQTPFEKIVEYLQPERNLSHSPLFQVMLVLHNNEAVTLNLPGLTFSPVELGEGVAKYDLTLNLIERDERLYLSWEYCTDLFELATIKRMAAHFENLLKGLVDTPEESVFKKDMLSDAERHQQLIEWNDTAADYRVSKCIHELFEAQVVESSYRTAVFFEDKHLTYGELNTQANQLAHYLADERGVKPGSLVGICVERSLEMVVAILGTLKAGGAYVPMDPNYPEERLAYMLEDSKVSTVITTSDLLSKTPMTAAQGLCLDKDSIQRLIRQKSTLNIDPGLSVLTPSCLAYEIYTSGSTGKPKGVMVKHVNVVNFLESMLERPGLTEVDCLLSVTSTSFDIHVLEIFLPLCVGSKMVIASKEAAMNPLRLIALMESHAITVMQATPVTWKMLLEANWRVTKSFKILCGGESINRSFVEKLFAVGEVEIWNMYGPTETTVWSCIKRLTPGLDPIFIGKPIKNTSIFVVSGCMGLLPQGVPGELLIGGDGVAHGYHDLSKLTSEKFIRSPFPEHGHERLYRTGDMVRWTKTGELEYMGRQDLQIKLRGFRVELGEIEVAILSYPKVLDAIVQLREIDGKEPILLTYIVMRESVADEYEAETQKRFRLELRGYLKDLLPGYMVPNAIIFLESIPLTPNRKINYKALPAVEIPDSHYLLPKTEKEIVLCRGLKELLSINVVDLGSDFFDLGGHSIIALRLISFLREAQYHADVKALFTSPTLVAFAETMEKVEWNNCNEVQAPSQLTPLTFSQLRFFSKGPVDPKPDIILRVQKLAAGIDIQQLSKSVDEVCDIHSSLKSKFFCKDGRWYSEIVKNDNLTLTKTIKVTETKDTDTSKILNDIAHDEMLEFDFQTGKLIKFIVVYIPSEGWFLLFVCHHILVDAYSIGIIEQDIARCYAGKILKPFTDNIIRTAHLVSIARKMDDYIYNGGMAQEIEFWSNQTIPEVHGLPFDYEADIEQKKSTEKSKYFVIDNVFTPKIIHVLNENRLSILHALIYCIVESAVSVTKEGWVQLDCSFNGRADFEGVDCSRTVGYLAHRRMLFLKSHEQESSIDQCKSVRDQINKIPLYGTAYHLLPHLIDDGCHRPDYNRQFSLNFQDVRTSGRKSLDEKSYLAVEKESHVELINGFSESHDRYYLFEMIATLANDGIHLECRYSSKQYSEKTVESYLGKMMSSLKKLA